MYAVSGRHPKVRGGIPLSRHHRPQLRVRPDGIWRRGNVPYCLYYVLVGPAMKSNCTRDIASPAHESFVSRWAIRSAMMRCLEHDAMSRALGQSTSRREATTYIPVTQFSCFLHSCGLFFKLETAGRKTLTARVLAGDITTPNYNSSRRRSFQIPGTKLSSNSRSVVTVSQQSTA